ncbi:uncharacterized protein LOC120113971 [Hibiscus syriacus]|uniref:uncharacterized protein LOC120113971 n=1 Tax=Hibiscus syriacus TaxID=106335 RepID=UPI0019249A4B|nr:uncharacterized protein LOC120113971 [Hibiscus syriacus]
MAIEGNEQELNFFPPSTTEGSCVVKPPRFVFEEGILEWRNALVGQFIGSAPSFTSLQKTVGLLWGKQSPVKVSLAGPNLFVFSFVSSLARDWVLENGSWHVQHKSICLRKWEPNLKELSFDLHCMPVWIHLYNVQLELFSKKGLSYVASAIGKPLHIDSITASIERLEYARVCVEISAGSQIPDFINVMLCDDSIAKVRVSVHWMANYCADCHRFGHLAKFCTQGKKVEQVWRVKDSSQGVESTSVVSSKGGSLAAPVCLNLLSVNGPPDFSSIKTDPIGNSTNLTSAADAILEVDGALTTLAPNDEALADQSSKQIEHHALVIDPHVKRGRGRPAKDKAGGGGSKNKFDVLSSIDPNSLVGVPLVDSGKKQRGAALGLAKVVQDMKLKKKDQLEKENLDCSICSIFEQCITLKGSYNDKPFFISAVYGSNNGVARRHLWAQLVSMDRLVGNVAWLIGGDFNVVLKDEESSNPISLYANSDVAEFQMCVEDIGVFDHLFIGPLFTWSNKQQGSFLARKLDRVLVNHSWAETFPSSEVEFQAPGESDHCPAFVWLHNEAAIAMPKPFKLFNFWVMHPSFLSIVRDSWQAPATRNPTQLANLDATIVGNLVIDELKIEEELKAFKQMELLFYKQKAKADWIREGDQSTQFFYSMVASKRMNNTIRVFYSQYGVRLNSFEDMSREAINFFRKELLGYSLPEGAAEALTREVSDVEIKDAIWGQCNNKSPGPDGYNSFLFKKTWHIVGNDFLAAIRYFFTSSFMLPSFNATVVVLVPKVPNPSLVKDYRPISCCSVIYKTATRILVNRLSAVFPSMIALNQSAFVKGRSIIDNTLLVQELVRGYSRKKASPRCALKIDLQKAFDSLSWDFVKVVLHALGLPEKFIGYFKGARGVRKGDPLSPYVFVLAMNVLSSLLNLAAEKRVFNFHPKCRKVGLTHLCFADDLLIFCKGSLESVIGVHVVLELFYSIPIVAIQDLTGFKLGSLPVRYLGVPLVTRKLSVKECRSLIDKIRAKLNSWANKHLIFTGRIQLIRAVLFSMASFWCRQLILPKKVILSIEQLCSRFFWKGSNVPAKGVRVSWKKICAAKAEGGLGVQAMGEWNKARAVFLIKKLLANKGSLWVAWIHAYVIGSADFWQMSIPTNVSWSFRYILRVRPSVLHLFTGPIHNLSVRSIRDNLRIIFPKVSWQHLVWFPGRIPKHIIIVWMAILDRLPTRRPSVLWLQFCKGPMGAILALCGVYRGACSWEGELAWATYCFKGKSLIARVFRLAWAGHVYSIWKERNCRLYGGSARSVDALLQDIKAVIQIRLERSTICRSDECNAALCARWDIA